MSASLAHSLTAALLIAFVAPLAIGAVVPGGPSDAPSGSPADTPSHTTERPASVPALTVTLNEPLQSVLARYGAAGLNIIYTRRLVPAELRVTTLPDPSSTPLERLNAVLAPHGLRLTLLDPGNGVIESAEPSPPSLPVNIKRNASVDREELVEEIVVTSHYRLQRELQQRQTLDHEALLAQPSLGRDLLRSLDGIVGVNSSGVSARQRFRGGDTNEVLYRLDGVELLEPFHLRGLQDLFSTINLNVVEAADVYVSGFPVSMGGRMSGVVDLLPIEPARTFQGGIDINPITASADASGASGSWQWITSLRRSLLQHTVSLFESDYGEPRFEDQFIRLSRDFSDGTVAVGMLRSRDQIEVQASGEAGQLASTYKAGWVQWTQDLTGSLSSVLQISAIDIDNRRRGSVDVEDFSRGSLRDQRRFNNTGIRNDWNWQISERRELNTGWSIQFQEGQFSADFDSQYQALALPIQTSASVVRQLDLDRDGENMMAYAAWRERLSERLTVQTGLRYDGQDIDPVHVNELSARVDLSYRLTPRLHGILNIGRYTQQQHLYEIQIDDGKAELDPPQHSDQINLTLTWTPTDTSRLRMDLYHRSIRSPWSHYENLYNQWVLFPELHGDRFEIAPDRARVRGFEISFDHQPSERFSWQISYAAAQAREHYLQQYRLRPWSQRHTFKAGLTWHSEHWRVGVNTTYRSGWPTSKRIDAAEDLTTAVFNRQLPAYFTLNAHVSRLIALPRSQLEIYLDISNATDRENIGGYDYFLNAPAKPQPLLPMLPTLGLAWRW